MDRPDFKNRVHEIYNKSICLDIKNQKQVKSKILHKYDDKSCDNIFIDWCKPINEIELVTREEEGANDIV